MALGRRRGPRAAARADGFTLLELLVAVSILALISVLSWRGLTTLTQTRDRLGPQNDAVRSVLAGFGQMERDLAQAPRNTNLFALPGQPVHVVSINGHPSLQITRLADSPDGSTASAVQTVFYTVANGVLRRQSTPAQRFYSPGGASTLDSVDLVPQVEDMQIRVWRYNVGWIAPASDADTANVPGIEVRLLRHDGTELRRVFTVG